MPLDTYKDVDQALRKDTFQDDDVQNNILYQVEKMNVDLIIIDSRGESAFSTISEQDPRLLQMLADFQSIVENDTVPGYVMQQTDDDILYRTGDWQGSTEYLKMYGYFSDSSFFMMQSSLPTVTGTQTRRPASRSTVRPIITFPPTDPTFTEYPVPTLFSTRKCLSLGL